MKQLSVILLLISFLILSSCASDPLKAGKAKQIPPERIIGKPTTTSKTPAQVTVVRDTGFAGGGYSILLKIDGKEIAKFNTGEKMSFELEPGSHIFSVKNWADSPVEVETILKVGETAYYRISVLASTITIQKSAEIGD